MLIAANGIGGGMFAAPNTSSMMRRVPPSQRGVASGMSAMFQNSGTALFHKGLVVVFGMSVGLAVLAALASVLRGGRHVPSDVLLSTDRVNRLRSAGVLGRYYRRP